MAFGPFDCYHRLLFWHCVVVLHQTVEEVDNLTSRDAAIGVYLPLGVLFKVIHEHFTQVTKVVDVGRAGIAEV
jgi:hypothetical protein